MKRLLGSMMVTVFLLAAFGCGKPEGFGGAVPSEKAASEPETPPAPLKSEKDVLLRKIADAKKALDYDEAAAYAEMALLLPDLSEDEKASLEKQLAEFREMSAIREKRPASGAK